MSTQRPPAASRLCFAPTLLVTGFEPFGDHAINPSAILAHALDGATIADHRILGRVLPVDTTTVVAALEAAIAEAGSPALVLCTGLAADRASLALERTAVNVLAFDIPDNAGNLIREGLIHQNGDAAHFAKLPIEEIIAAWHSAGIPGYVSETAGTYVCNQIFYEVLALKGPSMLSGFLHLPCSHELAIARGAAKTPSLSLETMQTGVEILIATALGHMHGA